MYTAQQLFEEDPKFFENNIEISEYWEKVQVQAAGHMRRLDSNPLFYIYRPNESTEIRDYRDTVRRDITVEGTWSWINKVSRIFIEHGISVEEDSLSEPMKKWLQDGPFMISGESVSLNTFLYELVLPMMIEDPNSLIVPFPVVPGDPTINPMESGLNATDAVSVINLLVPSVRIKYISNFVVAWKAGTWKTPKGRKKDYFFVVDRESFYILKPVDTSSGKVEYQMTVWYTHNSGQVMASQLGGNLSKPGDEVDNGSKSLHQPTFYYESFLRSFFELADEVTTAFSDNQGVRLMHNSPKLIMDKLPCPAACASGWIVDRETKTKHVCEECGGGGYIRNPGPYSVIVRNRDDVDGESSHPTLEYATPPVNNLQQSYDTVWDLFKRAKQSIGLDLLEDVSESGVAKSRRLESLNDILRKVSGRFFNVVARHLKYVDTILIPKESARKPPRIKVPTDLEYKSQDILKEDAETALPSDRFQSQMDFFSKKYINSPVILKVHRLSLRWAPILLSTPEEININLVYGQFDNVDLAKQANAYNIFKEIADGLGDEAFLLEGNDELLFDLADTALAPLVKNAEGLTERLRLAISETNG